VRGRGGFTDSFAVWGCGRVVHFREGCCYFARGKWVEDAGFWWKKALEHQSVGWVEVRVFCVEEDCSKMVLEWSAKLVRVVEQ